MKNPEDLMMMKVYNHFNYFYNMCFLSLQKYIYTESDSDDEEN